MSSAIPAIHGTAGLPHCPESERAVIFGLGHADFAIVAPLLNDPQLPEYFFDPIRREVLDEVIKFRRKGVEKVDYLILAAVCDERVKVELEALFTGQKSAAMLATHITVLRNRWRTRQHIAASDRLAIASRAFAPTHELAALLETVRQFEQREPGSDDDLSGATAEPRFMWVEDFCALPPDEEWLIEDYLQPDSLSDLFGDSEAYKSFLMIDWACHIATGKAWRERPVKQGLALFIVGEGANGLKKRIKAWFEYHRLPFPKHNIAISRVPLALCDPKNAPALVADIRAFLQHRPAMPSFIALDTLNTHFGPGDESSTQDMTQFLSGMRELRIATGAHVMTSHHCGHGDKSRSRGSIVLHNGIDWEYRLERKPETRLTTLVNTKVKDADKPRPLTFEFHVTPLPWINNKGEPMTSGVLIPADDVAPEPRQLTRPQRIALDALRQECARHEDGWAFVADWRRVAVDMGISPAGSKQACTNAFSRAVEALSENSLVVCQAQKYQPAP